MSRFEIELETLVHTNPRLAKVKRIWPRLSILICGVLLVITIVMFSLYLEATSKDTKDSLKVNHVVSENERSNQSNGQPTTGFNCFTSNRKPPSEKTEIPTSFSLPTTLKGSKIHHKNTSIHHEVWGDIAKEMIRNMDVNVDPCNDFYSYACGGWERRHPLTANKTSITQGSLLQEKNLLILKSSLENSRLNYSQNEAVMKAARVYRSCLNTTAMLSQELQPLRNLIAKYGGWSVSNNYDSKISIQARIGKVARDLNVNTLFGVTVTTDGYASTKTILQLLPATIQPLSLYLGKDADSVKERENYKEIMTIIGKWFGGGNSRKKMMAIYEFEVKLAKIARGQDLETTMRESFLRSSRSFASIPDIRMTLDSFCYITGIPCTFLKEILRIVLGRRLTGREKLLNGLLASEVHLMRLYKFYLNYQRNSQIVADYITWRFVHEYTLALHPKYLSEISALRGLLSRPRWMFCIDKMMKSFDMPLGLMYVDANFNVKSRTTVKRMTDSIRHSFIARLPKHPWMDQVTQLKAKKKALAITISIGYPDYIKDSKRLENHYKSLNVHDDHFFANFKEMNHFLRMRNVRTYEKPVDKSAWTVSPARVNGFYNPKKNRIVYLAGILQPPFFDPHSPRYLSYGRIGSVIGHELTHAFDAKGRLYNKNGNIEDWWSSRAEKNFQEKSSCLEKQYNKYQFFGKKVDGKKTLNENIADDGGIKIAYDAYQHWVTKNHKETSLPGLKLNPDQLFFVGFAQLWCSVQNKEGAMRELKDVHSPKKFRVLGSLSNYEKFSEVFKCPPGSPMNPRSKCSVW